MSGTPLDRSVLASTPKLLFVLLSAVACSADVHDDGSHGEHGAERPDESDDEDDDTAGDQRGRGRSDGGTRHAGTGDSGDEGERIGRDAGASGSTSDGGRAVDAGGRTGASDAGRGADTGASGGSSDAGRSADAGSTAAPGTDVPAGCEVAPITPTMRDTYANMNNAYYEKYASANGVIVATGAKVDDAAVIRYCRLMQEMTSNEDVRRAIIADKMWFTMIDENEQLSSLPQIAKAYGTSLNQRARGLGGLTPTICAEDSIMCLPGDRWRGDCICPHEAGHTLYSSGIARVPSLSSRLKSITASAKASGRLANAYVWMDGNESGMMAWGVQAWYDCAINGSKGAYHSDINTRAELQRELPEFYQFLSELLPSDNQYKDCYAKP